MRKIYIVLFIAILLLTALACQRSAGVGSVENVATPYPAYNPTPDFSVPSGYYVTLKDGSMFRCDHIYWTFELKLECHVAGLVTVYDWTEVKDVQFKR